MDRGERHRRIIGWCGGKRDSSGEIGGQVSRTVEEKLRRAQPYGVVVEFRVAGVGDHAAAGHEQAEVGSGRIVGSRIGRGVSGEIDPFTAIPDSVVPALQRAVAEIVCERAAFATRRADKLV